MRKLLMIVAAVLIFAGAVVYWRLSIAQKAQRYPHTKLKFEEARFTVTGLTLSRLVLSDLHVGRELSVKTAEIVFDLANIRTRPVTRLSLRGVTVDATLDGPLRRRFMAPAGSSDPLSSETLGKIIRLVPALDVPALSLKAALDGRVLSASGSFRGDSDGSDGFAGTLAIDVARGKPGKVQEASVLWPKFTARSMFTVRGETVAFEGTASAAGDLSVKIKGRHRLLAGTGGADVAVDSLRFGPGALSLTRLLPHLTGVTIKDGAAGGTAHLSWKHTGIAGTASLKINGFEVSEEETGADIEGLSADIRVDRFLPLRTPSGQVIRVRRIDAGTALTDLMVRFSLNTKDASALPALRIEGFDAGFIGGILKVHPTVLDPEEKENRIMIELKDADLAALFTLIGIEGVSGEGRLSGVIPVRQVEAAVAIANGRMAAAGPGILRLRSAAVKQALAQGGKEIALMLNALEDFRYAFLTIEIDKELQGEGRILLKTRGYNPAVLDGRPFVINMNISGNVDRIAAVIAQALKLPAAVVRSIVPKTR